MLSKNKKLPLISVIIPAYNEERHLKECLESVKAQTYPNFELVFIDDGSTDKTKKIAKKYADKIVSQKHMGPGLARNKGAKASRGKILVFIDADMFLDRDYIKYITKPILENKTSATFTKEEYVANLQNIWSKCFQLDNNLSMRKRINDDSSKIRKFRAIKKDIFSRSQGYLIDTGYGEDEVLENAESIAAPRAICYHYNPDTLGDVYLSARWVGRSKNLKRTFNNLLRYSIINSFILSIKKIYEGAPFVFLIYKIVFDIGVFSGILYKNEKEGYAK